MKPTYNILVRTNAGVVSMLKDLDENQARGAMQAMSFSGDPWSNERIDLSIRARREGKAGFAIGGRYSSPSDVAHTDCWASDGSQLEVWPKPADYDARRQELEATYDARREARIGAASAYVKEGSRLLDQGGG